MSDTPVRPEYMKTLVREKLRDAVLRDNLQRAMEMSMKKRAAAVDDFRGSWESMRERAASIKRHVMSRLDSYLEEFEAAAIQAGAEVHFAANASEARRIVIEIAQSHGVRSIVKSKSMTTEEIGLTQFLEREGIETLETDLGEYIVQLAGEMPSHITGPAVHLSRHQIGALFAEKLGIEFTSDPEELTAIARAVLREKFLTADMGISGVNFAVAEDGTICIVENEGNARLSMSLPRVHVAVMGMEKIVPDMSSLALFLDMLGRSAAGQRSTSYTSLIRGPRREGEADGPDELHLVILDNGRSAMLADPDQREALHCIRCGACMNVCPVYRRVGGHAYGSMYPGPIGIVISPTFYGVEQTKALPFASSLCGACSEVCPVGIDLPSLILHNRGNVVSRGFTPAVERFAMRMYAVMMNNRHAYELAGTLFRWFAPLLRNRQGGLRIPPWSASRVFPSPPETTFRQLWKERQHERS